MSVLKSPENFTQKICQLVEPLYSGNLEDKGNWQMLRGAIMGRYMCCLGVALFIS